jgi:hypothetical protein
MNPLMKIPFQRLLRGLALLCLFATGCASAPKWNVSITKKTPSTISVDLIGVSDADKSTWGAYATEKYWQPGDIRRSQADKLSISSDLLKKDQPYVIPKDDPAWQRWYNNGATDLLVLADLHARFDAAADPQKKFLPLATKHWKAKGNTLEIELFDTEIRVKTRRKK